MSLCSGCHSGCCRSYVVPTTGADIMRIERRLGLDFWQFACRWEDKDGAIALRYAPHFHFADEPETPWVVCLMQTESQVFPGTTKCQFLRETSPDRDSPLGTGSCGIYKQRPSACRVFPTRFNETSELVVIHDVPERGKPLNSSPVYTLCPRPWTKEDVDPIQAAEDLAVARYEMQFFHLLAEQWNRRPQEWELFPHFLRMVYGARVVEERKQTEEAKPKPRHAA